MSTIDTITLDPATGGFPGADPAASQRFFDLLVGMGRDPSSLYNDGQGWGSNQSLASVVHGSGMRAH